MRKTLVEDDYFKVELLITKKENPLKLPDSPTLKKTYPREFESICQGFYRCRVPGGWIVQTCDERESKSGESMCFLPDPFCEWELKQSNKKESEA